MKRASYLFLVLTVPYRTFLN
uniref:Uncharacterized protein n=1 Tax=Arundo donax TaxID=35708 RepID=A0A0A8YLZ6_ARUDO